MKRRLAISILAVICIFRSIALPAQSITFAVDDVEPASKRIGSSISGKDIALDLHRNEEVGWSSKWEPEILADDDNLCSIGEDVLFQMLLRAWCQHRPIVLTPDAVWMVIAQGFSHYVNEHPEQMRRLLVSHDGKKELCVETHDLFSDQADWEELIGSFTSKIGKYTNNSLATTLVADFSTTGINERIASEVTLMDVVKPYFDYEAFYIICGIPSITLTGTPDDWRKVLDKTLALEAFGLDWWVEDLAPILEEFISAAEGNPDIPFWKDIVNRSRPKTIKGPTCAKRRDKLTKLDGWFLKLFPFDNKGRTPSVVTITKTVLPETVCVPFRYDILNPGGNIIASHDLEIVAGIIGIHEDPHTYTLTPKIGWFVRTVKPKETIEREKAELKAEMDSLTTSFIGPENEPPYVSVRNRYGNLLVDDWVETGSDMLAGSDVSGLSKPEIEPRGFAFGGYAGVGKECYAGAFKDYISSGLTMELGLDIFINRFNIKLDCPIKTGTITTDIVHKDVVWNSGERVSGGGLDLSLGYTVLDTDWLRLVPYAGLGAAYYAYCPREWKNAGKKADEMVGFRQVAGISAGIKLYRYLSKSNPMGGTGSGQRSIISSDNMWELILSPRIYAAHTSFPGLPHAWSINFGLSLNFTEWTR